MPGPVSDSYDPEFSTGENADLVRTAIKGVARKLAKPLPKELRDILEIVTEGPIGAKHTITLTENELRVARFALNRALETL